jgi:hypothetical protein
MSGSLLSQFCFLFLQFEKQTSIDAGKEVGLEVNTRKTK